MVMTKYLISSEQPILVVYYWLLKFWTVVNFKEINPDSFRLQIATGTQQMEP